MKNYSVDAQIQHDSGNDYMLRIFFYEDDEHVLDNTGNNLTIDRFIYIDTNDTCKLSTLKHKCKEIIYNLENFISEAILYYNENSDYEVTQDEIDYFNQGLSYYNLHKNDIMRNMITKEIYSLSNKIEYYRDILKKYQ